MKYPVQKFVLPVELSKYANGEIPPHLLSNCKPYGQLYWKAAASWEAMLDAASKQGIHYSHVGLGRPLKEQIALFEQRYSKKPTKRIPTITRTYKGKTYFLKEGMSPAGTPGTSKHGYYCAADIAAVVAGETVSLGSSKKHVNWLLVNAEKYGWSWEVADTTDPNFEIWHLVCFDCDKLPQTILSRPVSQATKIIKPKRQEKKGYKS